MQTRTFLFLRALALSTTLLILSACANDYKPQISFSSLETKITKLPSEKINALIIWNKEDVEDRDNFINRFMPSLVKQLDKAFQEKKIITKQITTSRNSLFIPEDEVNKFIEKTKITNVLKIYLTYALQGNRTRWGRADRIVFFRINMELIASENNTTLWEGVSDLTATEVLEEDKSTITNYSEAMALHLIRTLQKDKIIPSE